MAERARKTVRDLRRSNRSLLLRQIYFDGPLSRQELVEVTGLSAGSVSNVTSELFAGGLIVEAGSVDSEGGRPRTLLRVDSEGFPVIGVDVGETRVRVERFDLDLMERARADFPMRVGYWEPATIVEHIRAGIDAVTAGTSAPILGVGIGVPGIVQHGPRAVVHGQTIGWDAVPLEELLREAVDLPIFIDNGATTMGQAEMWFGAGREVDHAVFLLIGSGVGAAVIADGSPYRGVSSSAGEWGHMTARIGGRRCRCGGDGCLEAYIGAEAVIERFREATQGALEVADEEASLRDVIELAASADELGDDPDGSAVPAHALAARRVLDETALHIGVGIANLINLLNPERVIIGGWAGLMLGQRLLPDIQRTVERHALRHPLSQTRVELCRLGPDAVARGAATLPVAHFLDGGGVVRARVGARGGRTADVAGG